MSISPLDQATVRQLGSTLSIPSPVVLVKELLDNALDAAATSVEVRVTQDTVGKIEVRDNGCGIRADDFDMLGRRGHTSKIRTFDELTLIGGSTLGFRGLALASISALAEVSVTTSTADSRVGTVLSLQRNGGATKEKNRSTPVGTTVTVTGLFSQFPVRRQMAAKIAPQTIVKIRELLRSYAFARPQIRLSLRIFNSTNTSWSFSPRPSEGIKEAVIQLLGIEVALQCTSVLHSIKRDEQLEGDEPCSRPEGVNTKTSLFQKVLMLREFEDVPQAELAASHASTHTRQSRSERRGHFVMDAFLPRKDADFRKTSAGPFFSVDSRPVAATRGTFKQMYTLFKEHVNRTSSASSGPEPPKHPFLRVDVKCPPGSYDPNFEPTKNEVLFEDEQMLLEQFKAMLGETYPPAQDEVVPTTHKKASKAEASDLQDQPHDNLSVQVTTTAPGDFTAENQDCPIKIHVATQSGVGRGGDCIEAPETIPGPSKRPVRRVRQRKQAVDMSANFDDTTDEDNDSGDDGIAAQTGSNIVESDVPKEARGSLTLSKMAGPNIQHPTRLYTSDNEEAAPFPQGHHSMRTRSMHLLSDDEEPPILRHPALETHDVEVQDHTRLRKIAREPDEITHRATVGPRKPLSTSRNRRGLPDLRHGPSFLQSPPSSSPNDQGHRNKRSRKIDPVSRCVYDDGLFQTQIAFEGRRTRQSWKNRDIPANNMSRSSDPLQPHVGSTSGFGAITTPQRSGRPLDPEAHNLGLACRRRKHSEEPAKTPPPQFVPLHQRTSNNLESQNLREPEDDDEPLSTSLPQNDARNYLLRRRNSEIHKNPSKRKRVITDLMPLEHIPLSQATMDLVYRARNTRSYLLAQEVHAAKFDQYVRNGELGASLGANAILDITGRDRIIQRIMARTGGTRSEDLSVIKQELISSLSCLIPPISI